MTDFLNILLSFMEDAGEIAINNQASTASFLKEDKSVVTETDLRISALFKEKLKPLLDSGNHLIIDEENFTSTTKAFKEINEKEYTWIIDPIDGTCPYSNKLPFFGIGVGLYKNKKPYMSAIYLPALRELIYCDGENSYHVQNPFSPNEIKELLEHNKNKLNDNSVIFALHKANNPIKNNLTLSVFCVFVHATYTLLGRGICTLFEKPMSVWDMAAVIPISKSIGMEFYNLANDKPFNELNIDILEENWKLKGKHLLCAPDNYEQLKKTVI